MNDWTVIKTKTILGASTLVEHQDDDETPNKYGYRPSARYHLLPICTISIVKTPTPVKTLFHAKFDFSLIETKTSNFGLPTSVKSEPLYKEKESSVFFYLDKVKSSKDGGIKWIDVIDHFIMENQLHPAVRTFPYFVERYKKIPMPF